MNIIKHLAVASIALISCGDNKTVPDARIPDGPPPDAYCSDCPAAPTLGAQIDRVGRAAVSTALVRGFDPTPEAQEVKAAYNEADNVNAWFDAANITELAKNLALVDVLDKTSEGGGCGNQAFYNGMPNGGGTPSEASYVTLAGVLANDQLFLDTDKAMCAFYLAVEFGVATGSYTTCGGRAPYYDVVDFSYSMLAAGVSGFDIGATGITPKITDGVPPHGDYSDTFPYLGPPHAP